jgi:hypothetical protein
MEREILGITFQFLTTFGIWKKLLVCCLDFMAIVAQLLGVSSPPQFPMQFSTNISIDECKSRLLKAVNTGRWSYWLSEPPTRPEIYGAIQDNTFQLRIRTYRNRTGIKVFCGKTVWQGDVEVFDLAGHPKAKRAYAWSHLDGAKDERTRFVAVLEIPPVVSAETAVRVQIVKDVKEKR